jgi:hypothetical protein
MNIVDPEYLRRSALYYRERAEFEGDPGKAMLMRQLADAFDKEALELATAPPVVAEIDAWLGRHR